jgi:trans-aconitate methyltransferase
MFASLAELAKFYGTDKAEHKYCGHYERHLAELRERPFQLLEIGVQTGASLLMWEAYFPAAQITGIDIDPAPFPDTDRIDILRVNIRAFEPLTLFDVIVDDGSHMAFDITATHHRLWPYLVAGGWYVIEDLAAQWMGFYGGGSDGSSAIEWIEVVLRDIMLDRSEVSEAHLYGQILFLRKALA